MDASILALVLVFVSVQDSRAAYVRRWGKKSPYSDYGSSHSFPSMSSGFNTGSNSGFSSFGHDFDTHDMGGGKFNSMDDFKFANDFNSGYMNGQYGSSMSGHSNDVSVEPLDSSFNNHGSSFGYGDSKFSSGMDYSAGKSFGSSSPSSSDFRYEMSMAPSGKNLKDFSEGFKAGPGNPHITGRYGKVVGDMAGESHGGITNRGYDDQSGYGSMGSSASRFNYPEGRAFKGGKGGGFFQGYNPGVNPQSGRSSSFNINANYGTKDSFSQDKYAPSLGKGLNSLGLTSSNNQAYMIPGFGMTTTWRPNTK